MDLNMPVSNGYDACNKIKAFFANRREVKYSNAQESLVLDLSIFKPIIVACTAENIQSGQTRELIEQTGFDHAIETPLTI